MVQQGGDGFQWDEGNIAHATRHGFSVEQIEAALNDPYGCMASWVPASHEPREAFLGAIASGTILVIIYTMRGSRVRPISARKATRSERREYTEKQR